MILGLGTDLVEISRIRKIYGRWGLKFASHFLAERELLAIPEYPVTWLSGRFAAKEASAKALGTGFQNDISFKDFLIIPDAMGKPELKMRGQALEYAQKLGVKYCHLSISHEKEMALAIVIMEA